MLQESSDSRITVEAQRSKVASPRLLHCEEIDPGLKLSLSFVTDQALHHYWFYMMDSGPIEYQKPTSTGLGLSTADLQ